jgi:hypothetical protein
MHSYADVKISTSTLVMAHTHENRMVDRMFWRALVPLSICR